MGLTKIPRNEIKVGDVVGILDNCYIGWKAYKHCFVEKIEIARITPKRTKFVAVGGREFDRYQNFYAYDEEAQKEDALARKMIFFSNNLFLITQELKKNACRNVPDELVDELFLKTEEIKKMLGGGLSDGEIDNK